MSGWIYDQAQPNTPVTVDIYAGTTLVETVIANIYRSDVSPAGNHGFSYATPPSLKNGQNQSITVKAGASTWVLPGSSKIINCPAGSTGYQYYYSDTLTGISTGAWNYNGTLTPTSNGITTGGAGSLISKVAVPGGGQDYEVKMTLNLTTSGVRLQTQRTGVEQDADVTRRFEAVAVELGEAGHRTSVHNLVGERGGGEVEWLMVQMRAAGIEVVPVMVAQTTHRLRTLVIRQQLLPADGPAAVPDPVTWLEVSLVQRPAVRRPVVRIPTKIPLQRRIDG